MNEEELKKAVTDLLFDLHSMDKLSIQVINSISRHFKVDAYEICEANGITYFIES
jgi:hypothetical protein